MSGGDKKLANMLRDAAAERAERVAAFERRDDASLRMCAGHGDQLLQMGAFVFDPEARDKIYVQAGQRISDEAYAPYILAFAPASVVAKNVHGPGLTTKIPPVVVNTGIIWDEVWMSKS